MLSKIGGAGFRDGIRELGQFSLTEATPGWGLIEPKEGRGVVSPYFTAHRLCDATSEITPDTFAVLREHLPRYDDLPIPRTEPDGDPNPQWREELLSHADALYAQGVPGGDIAAVQATLMAIPPEQAPGYLARQAPAFLKEFPDGSWWFLSVDRLLLARFALLREEEREQAEPAVEQKQSCSEGAGDHRVVARE